MGFFNDFPQIDQIKQVLQTLCVNTMGANNIPEGWEIGHIATAVRQYCLQYQVDPVLCLAQGIAESHFAINPQAKRSRHHRNIFNWKNTDDGKNHTFATFEQGIEQYCKTMNKEYYWGTDPDNGLVGWVTAEMFIRHSAKRPIGGTYASAAGYTRTIAALVTKIKSIMKGDKSNG